PYVGCVVGMRGSIGDDAARNFAIGFYGGLGERESIWAAYKQGRAAIKLDGLPDSDRPQLKVSKGIDANQVVLAADPQIASASIPPGVGLIEIAAAPQVPLARLPSGGEYFVGRADTLMKLDRAWSSATTHILT